MRGRRNGEEYWFINRKNFDLGLRERWRNVFKWRYIFGYILSWILDEWIEVIFIKNNV